MYQHNFSFLFQDRETVQQLGEKNNDKRVKNPCMWTPCNNNELEKRQNFPCAARTTPGYVGLKSKSAT